MQFPVLHDQQTSSTNSPHSGFWTYQWGKLSLLLSPSEKMKEYTQFDCSYPFPIGSGYLQHIKIHDQAIFKALSFRKKKNSQLSSDPAKIVTYLEYFKGGKKGCSKNATLVPWRLENL